jgi:hypothetical protein
MSNSETAAHEALEILALLVSTIAAFDPDAFRVADG